MFTSSALPSLILLLCWCWCCWLLEDALLRLPLLVSAPLQAVPPLPCRGVGERLVDDEEEEGKVRFSRNEDALEPGADPGIRLMPGVCSVRESPLRAEPPLFSESLLPILERPASRSLWAISSVSTPWSLAVMIPSGPPPPSLCRSIVISWSARLSLPPPREGSSLNS